MKRFWIVCGLLVCIVGFGIFSVFHLRGITEELKGQLDVLAELVTGQDQAALLESIQSFSDQWEEDESIMMQYIHHDELDDITGTVARLHALARFEDYAELAAEIDRLHHLVQHIYESELPSWDTIF